MFKEKVLLRSFWGEIVCAPIYILNKCSTQRLIGVVPLETWCGRKLSMNLLNTFGALCYYNHVPFQRRTKL